MLLDSLCKFSDGQAPTQGATTYSTYSMDLGDVTPKREVGAGEPLAVVISVGVLANVAADTFTFSVVSSTSGTDLSTSVKDVCSRLIAGALLTAGSQHVLVIPPGAVTQRYIGMRYVLGASDTVTIDADLVPLSMVPSQTKYADNVVWEA